MVGDEVTLGVEIEMQFGCGRWPLLTLVVDGDLDIALPLGLGILGNLILRAGINLADMLDASRLRCYQSRLRIFYGGGIVGAVHHPEDLHEMLGFLFLAVTAAPAVGGVVLLLNKVPLGIVIVARLYHEACIGLTLTVTEHQTAVVGVEEHLMIACMLMGCPFLDQEIGALDGFVIFMLLIEVVGDLTPIRDFCLLIGHIINYHAHVFGRLAVFAILCDFFLGLGVGSADLLDTVCLRISLGLSKTYSQQTNQYYQFFFHILL